MPGRKPRADDNSAKTHRSARHAHREAGHPPAAPSRRSDRRDRALRSRYVIGPGRERCAHLPICTACTLWRCPRRRTQIRMIGAQPDARSCEKRTSRTRSSAGRLVVSHRCAACCQIVSVKAASASASLAAAAMFWVMNSVYGRSLALATADDSPADEPRNCPARARSPALLLPPPQPRPSD